MDAVILRRIIRTLRIGIEQILPDGCPFVIGGGLIRDALGGARPGDIDIWLPSNITNCQLIRDALPNFRIMFPGAYLNAIFQGPGSTNDVDLVVAQNTGEYADINNHWVFEMTALNMPKINFMRTMVEWTGDAQAFFTGIMRGFDIDICMLYIGYMRGQENPTHVIMPQHMIQGLRNGTRQMRLNTAYGMQMNDLHWNAARLNRTAEARVLARIQKMNEKYAFHANMERIQPIPQDHIIAVPVELREFARYTDRLLPYPMPAYTRNLPDEPARSLLPPTRQGIVGNTVRFTNGATFTFG